MPDAYFLDLPAEGQWLPDTTIFPLKDLWMSQRRAAWALGLNPSLPVDGVGPFGDIPPTATVSLLGNISAGLSGQTVVEGQPVTVAYLKELPDWVKSMSESLKFEDKTLAEAFWAKLHPEDEMSQNFCEWMRTMVLAGFIFDPQTPEIP